MAKALDLTGQRFGRLMVIKRLENNNRGDTVWLCQCDCGNFSRAVSTRLKIGHTQSCGCLRREKLYKVNVLHRKSHSRLNNIWKSMKGRCYCESNTSFKDYGARGIKVCDEWRNDFLSFYNWAMANGYDENAPRGQCTLDRIDVNGNYCPENCRWVDQKTQMHNRRSDKKKKPTPAE